MKTTMKEKLARAGLGALLILGGFLFVMPLQLPSFFFGMMLMGIAVDARGTEFPEDEAGAAPAPKAKTQRKTAARRKAAS